MPTSHTTNDTRRAIHIDLESPYKYFTNDDIVRGTICVHPTARPNGILIVFSGRCNDRAQNTLTLFSIQQVLFNSGTDEESYAILDRGVARSGSVELPFEFQFPGEVEIAPGALYQPRPGFEHDKNHPLPTSMTHGGNKVEYVLEVAVYKNLNWSPIEVITLTLPFRPTADAITSNALVQHPERCDFYIRGYHLDPGAVSNPSALTKSKWATLSKYQHPVPEASWSIRARCPFLLIAGSVVPILFDFYHLGRSQGMREAPEVYVRRVRVKLTSLLSVRVPYGGPIGERDILDDIEDIEKGILSQDLDTTNTIMRHSLELGDIGQCILPPTVLPSFKTYGFRLVYRIKVVVYDYVGQETFKVTALRYYCRIVYDARLQERAATTSAAESTSRLPSSRLGQMAPVTEEHLPAYEEASAHQVASSSGKCRSLGALSL
jgi:hypothetical protein